METTDIQVIRRLNDEMRFSIFIHKSQVRFTPGVSSLDPLDIIMLMFKIQKFNDFTTANDPYSEHDFGSIDFKNTKYFWKIDYYDKSLEFGSDDPSNPDITTRILTIMEASEY